MKSRLASSFGIRCWLWVRTLALPAMVAAPASAARTFHYWSMTPEGGLIGLTNTPPGLTNAVAVSGGFAHFLALKADGKVAAWGYNIANQVFVPSGLSNVMAISAGGDRNAALTQSGKLVTWGATEQPSRDYPPLELDNVVAVSCGGAHTVVLRTDGTVGAWGPWQMNLTDFTVGLSNIVGIGAGDDHSLAIRADGTVAAWDTAATSVPPEVTNVVAVTGGTAHSLALRADGSIVAWGANFYGQTEVPVEATNVVAIAARRHASAALRSDGTIIGWGRIQGGNHPFTNPPPFLPFLFSVAVTYEGALALGNPNVATTAPVIFAQPRSQTSSYGSSVRLSVAAHGWGILSFQWYFNDTNALAGATSRALVLSNLQFDQAGAYTVRVSNTGGSVWSQAAYLNIVPAMHVDMVPRVRLDGQTGLVYRLDYINALGDPNVWFNLTNVFLNANPFFYLDESGVGQPQRFYRAMPLP